MKKVLSLLVIFLLLCACSNSHNNDDISVDKEENTIVEKTKSQLLEETLVEKSYTNIFTAVIPESWEMSVGGEDWYLWIRLYDPSNPALQIFNIISTTGILKSEQAKAFYQYAYNASGGSALYDPSANMVVNESGTMEEFFKDYPEYIDWIATYDTTFSGFDFPLISNFEVVESFDVDDSFSSVSIDNKLIYGKYTEALSTEKAEGFFHGAFTQGIKMMDPGYDCGYYILYGVNGISAPEGEFSEYEGVLLKIFNSITYTEEFLKNTAYNQEANYKDVMKQNEVLQQTSQMIIDRWNLMQETD